MRLLAPCLVLFASVAVAQEASFLEAPPGAMSCTGCHGPASDLTLAGLSADEIAAATLAFKSGEREGTVMSRIAAGFEADEIEAIAAWFAARGEE